MKKLLFFIFLSGLFLGAGNFAKAQMSRDTSLYNQKADDGVLVAYPNPTKDFLLLKSKDASLKIQTVTFYSILGVQVAQYNVNMNAGEINLDRLRPGKYLMRYILSNNMQKVTQIIKL